MLYNLGSWQTVGLYSKFSMSPHDSYVQCPNLLQNIVAVCKIYSIYCKADGDMKYTGKATFLSTVQNNLPDPASI